MQIHRRRKLLTIDCQRKKNLLFQSSLLNADHPRLVREQAAVYWAIEIGVGTSIFAENRL
jgi:hypothetical protein